MYWGLRQKQRGLTFVETILVISLFSILMLVVSNSIISFYKFNSYTISQAYQVNSARRGIELLVRDLREMTYADDGTFPLAEMGEHTVSFYSDIDRDDSVEYIEYELASTTLYKRVYNATGSPPVYDTVTPDETHTISKFVQNNLQGTTTFMYYDGNGSPAVATTTITDIAYIEAQVIVNIDAARNPGQFMLRSSAALRNLKVTP